MSALTPITDLVSLTEEKLLTKLNSHLSGLSDAEAKHRLHTFGYNRLVEEKKSHIAIEYLKNYKDPLVIVLFLVAIVSIATGEHINALLVTLMVILSTTLNFFQEHKASQAAAKLQAKVAATATVVRGRTSLSIPADHVVPGDIITLKAGDLVPADAIILDSHDLFANQSALTGESFPVAKNPGPLNTKHPDLSSLTNVIFSGTSIVTGSGTAVVAATGPHTEFGRIAATLEQTPEDNDFTLGVKRFSYFILRIILFFVLFIFLVNSVVKHDLLQSLTFAIAVAVGLTPEFLPMIMTVTMGRGSVAMAAGGVIVKRLTAIPTFGSMDILATDKTGTLTENHIKLVKYLNLKGESSESVLLHAYLNSHFESSLKSPMDDAILDFKHLKISDYKKVEEIPFDFYRKRSSVVVTHGRKHLLITKGAPEEVLASCSSYCDGGACKPITTTHKRDFIHLYQDLSQQGFRVLAVATKTLPTSQHAFSKYDEAGLELLGFTAFLDPAKTGVKAAIDQLEARGIEIKIITGDNELVTQKICADVGVHVKGILLGHQLDRLTTAGLKRKIETTTIFARFSPEQKNRIIELLRSNGHVVGYMGDGINDAPSLQSADVGISVSNAVDVAKESADLILTHKSLEQLSAGVAAGRATFGNTMKYIMMGISSNFGNMFSVLGAVLFLPFLPMLPIQILLNNFLYDLSQLTIPSDHVDPEYINTPKRWDTKFIRKFMFIFGPISSIYDYATFILLYLIFKTSPAIFQTSWFVESLATQTLVIHIIRTKQVPFIKSLSSRYLMFSTLAVVAIGWLIPFTPLGPIFSFTTIPLPLILSLAAIVFLYLITVDLGKALLYHHQNA